MGLSNVEDILQAGLEGTDMPRPESRIAELLKEWIEQGGNIDDILVAGANITLTKNADGTITISASGEVSSEDTVARESIANHKADKSNPHEVTKAQVGLGNVDNTADLDKPLSTAAQTALDGKQGTISDLATIRSGAALGATAVQPETGKGLSSNDYTTAEKTKLDSLAEIKTIGTGLNLDDNGELTATGGGTGGTTNYNDLSNKPQINGNTLSGNKTGAQLGLASASDIPTTLAELTDDATHRVVTDTEKATWNAKADVTDIPDVPVKGIKKNGTAITPDASGVVNITVPTSAADVSALPATTLYGASISLSINTTTFVVTATLKDQNGDTLGTAQTIDLPLESVVVNGSYNSATKKVVLTLQNGSTVEFSVADLVAGLQSEITSTNKLNPAFINYDSTHRAVSDAEKNAWNAKASTATATTSTAGLMSSDDKTKLNGVAEGAEMNVQSDWNATDTSSDAYIKNKPIIPSASSASPKMDGTASSGSSSYWSRADHVHPTDTSRQAALSASQLEATNSGITNAELVELVDNGAKNLINNTAVSTSIFTVNSDGTVLVNGSSGTSNRILNLEDKERSYPYDTVLSGCPSSGGYVNRYSLYLADANGNLVTLSTTTGAADEGDTILIPANTTFKYVRILVRANQTINNLIFKPMLCSKTAWDISQAYVPHSPTNAELYEMIKALQS